MLSTSRLHLYTVIPKMSILEKFSIPACIISTNAKQKYVLLEIVDSVNKTREMLVRGNSSASYHQDVADPVVSKLDSHGVEYNILGGGRLIHTEEEKKITIYGYSIGYPWDEGIYRHDFAQQIVQQSFNEYEVVVDNTPGLY